MTDAVPTGLIGRFYATVTGADGLLDVALVERSMPTARLVGGRLVSDVVEVVTHAVVVGRDEDGPLRGIPVAPLDGFGGRLCFDPSGGGARARENRRAQGAFNGLVEEANGFGMVNAFVHTESVATRVNSWLADLGRPALPPVRVVVGAHFGSNLPGYGRGDGDRWSGRLRPMSGGHYRLSARTTGIAEPATVVPTGEIHLGPSRYRKPFAGSLAYLRNAAHNPAIIYHEYGHHLCRHTADFRLNAERAPDEQRNGKTGIEEAIGDYLAAVLLDNARPYGWYRADGGRRRDLDQERHADDVDGDDPHALGAPWAAALWRSRTELVARGLLASADDHDRAVVAALVSVGGVAGPEDERSLTRRERKRNRPQTFTRALRRAVRDAGGSAAGRATMTIMECHGLVDQATLIGQERPAC